MADYVIVSMHAHANKGIPKENVADFHKEIAHASIDAGADALIGHGPHIIREIEVYKDRPIFYSLGDFIIQLYSVEFAPYDFYNKAGVSEDKTVAELLKTRSKNCTIGLMEDKRMLESIIPLWEIEDGKLKYIKLLPLECKVKCAKAGEGLPLIATSDDILNKLNSLCSGNGLTFTKNCKFIDCNWKK